LDAAGEGDGLLDEGSGFDEAAENEAVEEVAGMKGIEGIEGDEGSLPTDAVMADVSQEQPSFPRGDETGRAANEDTNCLK